MKLEVQQFGLKRLNKGGITILLIKYRRVNRLYLIIQLINRLNFMGG